MPVTRSQRSSGQPPDGVACHRAHPPMSRLDSLQGASSLTARFKPPDVTSTNLNLAGSSDGVAAGGQSTFLNSQSLQNSTYINDNCDSCTNNFSSCNHKQCKLCPSYKNNHTFTSSNTGRTFHVQSDINLNCDTQNVIYLITCNYCKLQYVGETSKKLKVRFNNHRSSAKAENSTKLLYEHFKNYPCSGYGYNVQIIQKIEGSGHLDNGKIDPSITQTRLHAEETWISRLQTIFPYGLNDRYKNKDFRNRNEYEYIARNHYFKLDQNITYERKRSIKSAKSQETPEMIFNQFYTCCKCNGTDELSCSSCVLNCIRIKVDSMKKSTAKKLGTYTKNLIYSSTLSTNFLPQYYDVLLDRINSKFAPTVQKSTKPTKAKPDLVCKIVFSDKHIQDINLSRIFRDKSVLNALPDTVPNIRPTVVYSYLKPIRNKIFNYKETINDLNVSEFIENYNNTHCDCEHSNFKDAHHNHIITGNLDIIENDMLKNLFSQGPQYREIPNSTNFRKLKKELQFQIKKFTNSWSSKYKIPIEALAEWKVQVFHLLNLKIAQIKSNPRRPTKEVLKNQDALNYLDKLKENYVLAPVDKASNNISIICKKYYIKTVLTEVGLWPDSDNLTYRPLPNSSKQEIIDNQYKFNNSHNIKDNSKINHLPFIYAIPKFHKNPVKFRYIISSSNCQTKPLAKVVSKGLKLCQNQHESWCRVLRSYTSINHCFIIDKNQPILDTLNELSDQNKAKTIETFDFSTLYTMIKHEDLINNLNWFIEKAYNGALGKGKTFMSIYTNEAKWVSKPKSTTTSFNKIQFQEIVKYLIENSIFEVGTQLIQQTIGIPMGTDPGPFMANAHLHKFEFQFQEHNRKNNFGLAKSLNRTFRYIDDVTPINDNGNFSKYLTEIYPPDLILTKENVGTLSATVLDLEVQINNNKFDISVYDKTDKFGFHVIKYPSVQSNIPDNVLYNVFYSQTLRYLNICNNSTNFLFHLTNLINKCKLKGASKHNLNVQIRKLFQNRPGLVQKLNLNLNSTIIK